VDELIERARSAQQQGVANGFVWQGARYEGLVTVFVEFIGAFGGRILDDAGNVVVDSDASVRALTAMRDLIHTQRVSPQSVLTWQEEQTRFAFQNGSAAFMRNWPYAYTLMSDSAESRVAGRFAVAPMPAAAGGEPTAALGGAQLAINAHSRHPDLAYALIAFLTAPEQMLERARAVGQFPPRPALYDMPELADALAIPPEQARAIISAAQPRPVTPVYTELSQILQIHLHRALTRQREPAVALAEAAAEIRTLLERTGLAGGAADAR